jgi:aminoglycoside 3-N-acetyltransferase
VLFAHGIQPNHEMLYTILPDKTEITIPQRRHTGHTSEKYNRVEDIFLKNQVMYKGQFGYATVKVCDTVKMTELLNHLLKGKPDLFS